MIDQNNTKETIKLIDKDGLADLMALLDNDSYVDSLQLGANLIMLGLIQFRVFDVPEADILDAVKTQVPLADMLMEIIADSGATDATGT